MNCTEQAIAFPCAGEQLLGIVAMPEQPAKTGVLIIVGGPQYRVGSHRQFALLARALAAAGIPAMRFDYRGMGDSSGEPQAFTAVDDDIAAAIDAFYAHCPQLDGVVLWGLCDAASASLLYWDATRDARVRGMILLNPWVRSEATLARAHIRHYYGQRLLQVAFWRKLLTGQLGIGRALGGFVGSLLQARRRDGALHAGVPMSFQDRMLRGLGEFSGPALLVLSGNDYTAKEFREASNGSPGWQQALNRPGVTVTEVAAADHTFSSAEWRAAVERLTVDWVERVARR